MHSHSYLLSNYVRKLAIFYMQINVTISYRKVSISVNFSLYRIVLKILVSPITNYNMHNYNLPKISIMGQQLVTFADIS